VNLAIDYEHLAHRRARAGTVCDGARVQAGFQYPQCSPICTPRVKTGVRSLLPLGFGVTRVSQRQSTAPHFPFLINRKTASVRDASVEYRGCDRDGTGASDFESYGVKDWRAFAMTLGLRGD